VASNLGDPDAQNDLGFCYSHGLGVKKDLYSAAKYYRLAERQGQGMIGNSWIWKEKYNQVEAPDWKGKTKEKK
jgi:TPR repeat protein